MVAWSLYMYVYIHRHHNDNICMFDYLSFTAECASMFVVEWNVDFIFICIHKVDHKTELWKSGRLCFVYNLFIMKKQVCLLQTNLINS